MSCEPAIQICDVGKCYEIYAKPQHRLWQSVFRGRRQFYREFWALRGVNFDVQRGETFGIVGRNGSGKSTLLQIVAGTLQSTTGRVIVRGRVAALLELGSGFNPEFTGRENVFLNAAMLGLSHAEIEKRYDAIVAFSEIGDFVDQPVKTYSSGMYVRLAFAVAINVDPDILIVDEALSVGDEAFQRKCFARIRAIRENGSTILFVSHAGSTVIELCNRAVLLDHGEQLLLGSPKPVVSRYQQLMYAPPQDAARLRDEFKAMGTMLSADGAIPGPADAGGSAVKNAPCQEAAPISAPYAKPPPDSYDPNLRPKSTIVYPSRGARIESPHITRLDGSPVNILCRRQEYEYRYRVHFERSATNVRFGMLIKTVTGLELGGTSLPADGVEFIPAGAAMDVRICFLCLLTEGVYFNNAGVIDGSQEYLGRIIDGVMFRVQPDQLNPMTGTVDFLFQPAHLELHVPTAGKTQ
ncbi:MAG: ABC transporter ATP-binding protein [Phycisphaerae bacterium]|nr:ABC transporter ATP-binding protein [Phycisphaerae bacterium]